MAIIHRSELVELSSALDTKEYFRYTKNAEIKGFKIKSLQLHRELTKEIPQSFYFFGMTDVV